MDLASSSFTNAKPMKIKTPFSLAILVVFVSIGAVAAFGQTPKLLKRTTYKTDKFDFGVGGTVAIVGAPVGSIRVEGTQKSEIEISAEIEIQAPTEADLETLSKVSGFILEESPGRTGIVSIGAYDKKSMGKAAKKFPKELFGLPLKIDYVVKVPRYCDLQIDSGKGDLTISGVEGAMKINSVDTKASLALIGGGVNATFGAGSVDVTLPNRSWRGNAIDMALNYGSMSVHLPWNLSGELDATILRTGQIENGLTELKPRDRKVPISDKLIAARAGNGGVPMKFTVGDGTLSLVPFTKPQ
jgi:hypothetical protein